MTTDRTYYVHVLDNAAAGVRLGGRGYLTEDAANEAIPVDRALLDGARLGYKFTEVVPIVITDPHLIELDLGRLHHFAPTPPTPPALDPPLKLDVLGAGDTLVVTVSPHCSELVLEPMVAELNRAIPGRWLIAGVDAEIMAGLAAQVPANGLEDPPLTFYAPELVTRLKGLTRRYPADAIAAAAKALAKLVAEYGPDSAEVAKAGLE